ncbi:hypothetical protein GCM10007978_24320 [Shewanella hanedai]|uniref:Tip attachment protein J central straight fiber domain-containing protein n=1 Tax=Shewanella hanedai TaxID=25 RepID=A0A553JN08_SHEHA|nr:hypothetical protein [Shewanella hanedai]TRY13846.1 hypothetical protein FN961_13085 [Shewanella hanedai]GGI85805.1 hypothetical protein GCM10007978_24320 [Shewanella hanedai]
MIMGCGPYGALWGVKTTVAGLTSSIGLVNDGVDPIFAVKGAKFAIITSQDPNNLTPVFAVVDGKTVMKTALIDEAHIQSLVTDDLLSNRVVVGSQLTSPSINYNPTTGARSNNFSIDPNGNMHAKSAVLESVTIKDNLGNVVLSSTGAIASSQVTGLGALATLNSLGYSALTGKPTLGSLAAKNNITLASVTDSGVFAGLDKILSTNVTTYIASGAIGTAQIDQAWIAELFGNNATFSGTVYANRIEGDLVDGDTVVVSASDVQPDFQTIKTINVRPNPHYPQWLSVGELYTSPTYLEGIAAVFTRLKLNSQVGKAIVIPAGSSFVSVAVQAKSMTLKAQADSTLSADIPSQPLVLQMYRKGSGFIT